MVGHRFFTIILIIFLIVQVNMNINFPSGAKQYDNIDLIGENIKFGFGSEHVLGEIAQKNAFKLKILNLSYLVFNYKKRNHNGFTGYYSFLDALKLIKALYLNAVKYGNRTSLIGSFGLLATIAYFTRNYTMIREAEQLWNQLKSKSLIYDKPILVYSNSTHEFYRIPYFARISEKNNKTWFYSQFMGLYFTWKMTGNATYFKELEKSFGYRESLLENGKNKTYYYGYLYNIVWNPASILVNETCPPYGTPIMNFYWNGEALNSYNYWTWGSAIVTVFNIALKEGLVSERAYAKIFRDLFYVLWNEKYKMIDEAWLPKNNKTYSLFGLGKTRIHVYNLGAFMIAAQYYPDIKNKLETMVDTMLKYWIESRKMYIYNLGTKTTFEQFMMTIPNALHHLNNQSSEIRKRNIYAILTYLLAGVLKRPVAWPLTSSYYGILHAKEVSNVWKEVDSGAPSYVSIKNTHEGYSTAYYLLNQYGLEQLYFNEYVYSLINNLPNFINKTGYLHMLYILDKGLKSVTLHPNSINFLTYYPMLYKAKLGKAWQDDFKYNYRWNFPEMIIGLSNKENETEISITLRDVVLNNESLIFIPFYNSAKDRAPLYNVKRILINGKDYTKKAVIFTDNVIAFSKLNTIVNARNLTIIYSNNPKYTSDSDKDMLTDYWEKLNNYNPGKNDTNGDGILDYYDALYGPFQKDTEAYDDNDKIPMIYEQYYLTSPYKNDTDNDGLTDGFEIAFNLNPMDIDTDNDGILDGIELNWCLNPRTRYTQGESDRSDYFWYAVIEKNGTWTREKEIEYEKSLDFDNDGINNYLEFHSGSDIFKETPYFLQITQPSNNTYINSSNTVVKWNYTSDTQVSYFLVYLDGNIVYNGTENSLRLMGLKEGSHNITIVMFINCEIKFKSTVIIHVDITPPEIVLTPNINHTEITEKNIKLNVSCFDNMSGVTKVEVKINERDWVKINTTGIIEVTDLEDGENTIYIKAQDKAGNIKQIKIYLTVQTENTPDDNSVFVNLTLVLILVIIITLGLGILWKKKYIVREYGKP